MSTPLDPRLDDADGAAAPTKSAAARLFDIRLLIGGLFLVYGVMLTVAGLFTSDAERKKAAGININLWLGIGMLIVGALFVLWLRLRPLVPDVVGQHEGEDRPPMH